MTTDRPSRNLQMQLDQLIEALMVQQDALLRRDSAGLKEATSKLEVSLSMLENSAGRRVHASDAQQILRARALSQMNAWLLANWDDWANQVYNVLQAQHVDLIEASC